MPFGLKNPFKRQKKKEKPLEDDEFESEEDYFPLPDEEEPEEPNPIRPLKPEPPRGTVINPAIIIAGVIGLVAMITYVFVVGISDPDPETEKVKTEEESRQVNAPSRATLPDEVKSLPGSYSLAEKKDTKSATKTKETTSLYTRPEQLYIPNTTPRTTVQPYTNPIQNPYLYQLAGQQNISPAERDAQNALKSPIRFAIQAGAQAAASLVSSESTNGIAQAAAAAPLTPMSSQDSFLEKNSGQSSTFYLNSRIQQPISQFEVKAGTLIPGIMISGINSELPGQVSAQVRENVYDTVTGDYLLIPASTKMIGSYDSNTEYGQDRLLVVWKRLIFPNGSSLDLEGMIGSDTSGYSGFHDKKNDHIPRLLNGVLLGSLLTAGATMATGGVNTMNPSYSQLVGQGVAENVIQASSQITERNLNVKPTLEIRPGYLFNIFVNKDMVLAPYGE